MLNVVTSDSTDTCSNHITAQNAKSNSQQCDQSSYTVKNNVQPDDPQTIQCDQSVKIEFKNLLNQEFEVKTHLNIPKDNSIIGPQTNLELITGNDSTEQNQENVENYSQNQFEQNQQSNMFANVEINFAFYEDAEICIDQSQYTGDVTKILHIQSVQDQMFNEYNTSEIIGTNTQTNTDQKVMKRKSLSSQHSMNKFEQNIFKAIQKYFEIEFETLEDALIYYRKQTVGTEDGKATKIHLNFKQIATESDIITDKDCRQKFYTLLENTLKPWPIEVVERVKARIPVLWNELPEQNQTTRKELIKETIENEFQFKQQVEYKYKEMQNKINYILKNLK
ncbi:Hypothetical_protein [Hexamita inflata]|uniref:Hypothetical_protein n=1 Tax=Hexamita inflata TaxID=28002 RepID=A0AA86ULB4_9EUKA|nr:Hypothetical protein HINF_LOCUS50340 [Hexamita inflata]